MIGLVTFGVAFPFYILDPENVSWIYPFPSQSILPYDFHTHYLGWLFLRGAPVSFPFGEISNYVSPLSTYLAYTDSLPLMAFFFRFFTNSLPQDFQYFGMWVLLCCVLQAVFAYRILCRVVSDRFCLFAGVALISFSPLLLRRWHHVALMSQWLILWALDLNLEYHLRKSREHAAAVPLARAASLIALTTMVQPYLAAMVAGICWALPLGQYLRESRGSNHGKIVLLARLGVSTVALILPMIVILYCFGFLEGSSRGPGFHYFGTDLLAIFNNHGTSSFIPSFKIKAGLSEGYAWPGLGGWVLILCALNPNVRGGVVNAWRQPGVRAVAISCLLMWFFALSERIHVGTFWLIDMAWFWDPFAFVTSSLRTCGRFVWPIYYLVFLAAIAAVSVFYPLKRARALMFVALFSQAVDLGPWMAAKEQRFGISPRQALRDPFWSGEALGYRHIKLIPPAQDNGYCHVQAGDYFYEWVEFAQLAAKHNMTVNSGYLARYDRLPAQAYCGAHWYEFVAGPLKSDSLYVVRRNYIDGVPTSAPDRTCRSMDGYMVCVARK